MRKIWLLLIVAALSACADIQDVKSGDFRNFHIGMDKVQSLDAIRIENSSAVIQGDDPNCRAYGSVRTPVDKNAALMECNTWSFSTNDKPTGAMFDLFFSNGHLIRIRYVRPYMTMP